MSTSNGYTKEQLEKEVNKAYKKGEEKAEIKWRIRLLNTQFEDLGRRTETNEKAIVALQVAVGKLQVKSGVWGFLAGLLPALAALLWSLLRR